LKITDRRKAELSPTIVRFAMADGMMRFRSYSPLIKVRVSPDFAFLRTSAIFSGVAFAMTMVKKLEKAKDTGTGFHDSSFLVSECP
jgi:hypothetical protein